MKAQAKWHANINRIKEWIEENCPEIHWWLKGKLHRMSLGCFISLFLTYLCRCYTLALAWERYKTKNVWVKTIGEEKRNIPTPALKSGHHWSTILSRKGTAFLALRTFATAVLVMSCVLVSETMSPSSAAGSLMLNLVLGLQMMLKN